MSPFLALALALAAPQATLAFAVCGAVETADGVALPAASRADLAAVESGYAWSLGILAGRAGAEPEATTGIEGGRFCLAAPRAGLWQVTVEAPGFVPVRSSPLPMTRDLELPPLRLPRDVGAQVLVRRAGGEPAGEVWVVAEPAERSLWPGLVASGWRPATRFARTGGDGRVALPRAPGEALALQAFAAGSAEPALARDQGSAGVVRLKLPRAAGRRVFEVRGAQDQVLPAVVATPAAHGWPVAVSDAEGRFALTFAAAAAVPLLLEGSDGRRRVIRLPGSPAQDGAGSERLALAPTPAVRGRVVDGGRRQGLPGALVWLGPDPGTFTVTDARGEYLLPAGGRERFQVQAEAAGFLPRETAVGAEHVAAGRVPELVLQPAVSAFGRVVDEHGMPLGGVLLEALPEAAAGRPGVAPGPGAPGPGTPGPGAPGPGAPGPGAASRAWSDAEGRFELTRMRPAVPYRVVARHAGFVALALPGVVLAAGRARSDLGALVLEPGARVEGLVTDARGVPVAGAEVRVRTSPGLPARGEADRLRQRPPDAVAGPRGRFVLPDLRPGRPLDLLTSRQGYLPAWTLGVEAPSAEPLAVVLEAACRLTGTLVDEGGEPVAGALVGLRWLGPDAGAVGLETRPGGGSRSTKTDARGALSFDELAPGWVEVTARADGFLPGRPTTLELPEAGEVSDLRLVLRRGAAIEGQVFDPDGEPLAGTRLRAALVEATSDADGRYRLRGLPLGLVGLFAHHPDYRQQIQEVEVERGVNTVDLFLEDGWSISGRTVDEGGEPVTAARVELRAGNPRAFGYLALSGEGGRFRVVVSEQGSFRLTATREGFAAGEITGLEVHEGPLEGVEVVLGRGTSVVGRILGLEPGDLAAITVEAQREDRLEPAATIAGMVDPQARYAIHHLPAGDWRIRAVLAGGRRQGEAAITAEPGVLQIERDLELGGGLRFTGRLLYAGAPVAAAHVSLSGLDVSGDRSVLSGHDGTFRIEGLAAGHYRLDVLDPARALSYLEDLELTADRELVLELEAAPLFGSVTAAESGEALEDALVYVYKLLPSGETGSLTTVDTDAAGEFVVAHLTAGRYLVSARKDGFAPAEQRIEVAAGAPPETVYLRLAAAGGLTLAVRLESGAVPRFVTVSAFDPSGRMLLTDTRPPTERGFVYFEQLPVGTWDLLVSAVGAAPAWVSATVPGTVPDVVLRQAAALTVRVPALMAAGATGTLTLAPEGGEAFFQVEPGGAIRSHWTLAAGLVTVGDLPAGVWNLRVDGARGGVWIGTVVTDGQRPSQVSLE